MNKNKAAPISELLSALADSLSASDILSSMLESKIALAISKERINRNMTQAEFAELLGVQQSQISKWEAEDYNFTIEKLAKIATALDMELNISLEKRAPLTANADHTCIYYRFPSHWSVKSGGYDDSEYEQQEM